MIRETPEGLKIYTSIWKFALLMLACVAFTVCSILMLRDPGNDPAKRVNYIVAGWMGIALFGVGGLITFFNRLPSLFRTPMITTDHGGLTYNRMPGVEQHIPWSAIAGFSVIKQGQLRYLAIQLRDLSYLMSNEPANLAEMSERRRKWLASLAALTGGRIMIPTDTLPGRGRRLVERIAQRHASEIVENGIKVKPK